MKSWTDSFPLRGNLGQLFELLRFIASKEAVSRDDCFRFSSLHTSDLLYDVKGIDNILGFYVFIHVVKRNEGSFLANRNVVGPILDEKNSAKRNQLFMHHVASRMREDFDVWAGFLRHLRTNKANQIALPNTGQFCLLRDILISCQLVTMENRQWVGLEKVEVIRKDYQKLLLSDRDRLKPIKTISPTQLKVQQEKQAAIGELGEQVWEYLENKRLRRIGHSKCCDVVAKRNCAAGYDIQSYSGAYSFCFDEFFEVKASSVFRDGFDFHFSFNEFNTASELKERYCLVLIYLASHKISYRLIRNPKKELGLSQEMWRPIENTKFDSIMISIKAPSFIQEAETVQLNSIQDVQIKDSLRALSQ